VCVDGPPAWADDRAATGSAVRYRHVILDEAIVALVGPLAEELEPGLPADRAALAAHMGEPSPVVRGARRLPEPEPTDPYLMPPWPDCELAEVLLKGISETDVEWRGWLLVATMQAAAMVRRRAVPPGARASGARPAGGGGDERRRGPARGRARA
jgi:hypothetical protein